MKDRLGNKIKEGDAIFLLEWGVPAKVTKIQGDSGITTGRGATPIPPMVFVEIGMNLNIDPRTITHGEEPTIPGFILAHDPAVPSERSTSGITAVPDKPRTN